MLKKVIILLLLLYQLLAIAFSEVVLWATADVHGVVNSSSGGLVGIYSLLEVKRKPTDLLIDAGDFFQGSYSANISGGTSLVNIFHAMDYDFCIPGNHEMDAGMENLRHLYSQLKVPVLCANWNFVSSLQNMKPYALVERNGIRIGIIGTGDRESRTRILPTEKVSFMKEEKAIAQALAALRPEKVDIIVLVRHGGIYFSGGNLYSLLKQFPEIDIVIGAHSHQVEKGRKIAGAYYVQPPAYGQGVSEVRAVYNKKTRKIERITSVLHSVSAVRTSDKMKKYIKNEQEYRVRSKSVIAEIVSKFTSTEDLQKYLIRQSSALLGKADADLFFIDKSGIEMKSAISDYMIYRMFPYENNVVQITVSRKEYQTILEECKKYSEKYKAVLLADFRGGKKQHIILRTSAFILSGGGRNFPAARSIAEKREITEFVSLRQLVKKYLNECSRNGKLFVDSTE